MSRQYWKTGAPKRRTANDRSPRGGEVWRQLGILIAGGAILIGFAAISIGSYSSTAAGAPIAQLPEALVSPTDIAPTAAPATAAPATTAPATTAPTSTALPPTATATIAATQASTSTPVAEATNTPTTQPPTAEPSPTAAPTADAVAATATPGVSGGAISYSRDVQPIFNQICVKCHGGEETKEGLSLKSYAEVMAGSNNGPILTAGDAANSLLIQQVVNGKMPKQGPKLLPAQIRTLSDWVAAGAPNN